MSWAACDPDGRGECLREHGRSGGWRDRDFFGCASRLASSGNCAVAIRKRTIQTQENQSRSSRVPELPVTSRGIWHNRSGRECPPAPPCPGLLPTWTVVASTGENTGDREDREIGILLLFEPFGVVGKLRSRDSKARDPNPRKSVPILPISRSSCDISRNQDDRSESEWPEALLARSPQAWPGDGKGRHVRFCNGLRCGSPRM